MQIPQQIKTKLEANPLLYGAVLSSVAAFEPWLQRSGTPFFPEYTDHSPLHIQNVLVSACSLISEQSWEVFTPQDAAVLVLACLLHDAGMHLSIASFLTLIETSSEPPIPSFDNKSWKSLWIEFVSEARRWDAKKLTNLFGKEDAGHVVRDVPRNPLELTLQDRLLAGEFLRRHHPRLAHEFAVLGVPNDGSANLCLLGLEHTAAEFGDIAGLVARSHGLPIRSCMDYLSKKYLVREYRGIHAIYLMSLLRIADYLQLEAERAPYQVSLSRNSVPGVKQVVRVEYNKKN